MRAARSVGYLEQLINAMRVARSVGYLEQCVLEGLPLQAVGTGGEHLRFGRIVVSEIEAPIMLVDERWYKATMRPSPIATSTSSRLSIFAS